MSDLREFTCFKLLLQEIQDLIWSFSFWAHCYRTETGFNKVGEWKRRRSSRGLAQLLKTPSSLKELFVLVDKYVFESEVRGKTEDQVEFWTEPRGIGAGFYDARKVALKYFGEGSSVLPRISMAWNFEMIWHGKDIELPEC